MDTFFEILGCILFWTFLSWWFSKKDTKKLPIGPVMTVNPKGDILVDKRLLPGWDDFVAKKFLTPKDIIFVYKKALKSPGKLTYFEQQIVQELANYFPRLRSAMGLS